jgi:hypothetical protein
MRMLTIAAISAVLVTAASVRTSGGQIVATPSSPWTNQTLGMSQPDIMRHMEQQRMRTTERQKQLVKDTDKLLRLSTALKEQVDDADKNVLSLDMIKKAEEIEKLAHSVKERIKS